MVHPVFPQLAIELRIQISHSLFLFFSLLEGVNLLVSSGTASAIAGDRLRLVKRKTARQDDTKVPFIKASYPVRTTSLQIFCPISVLTDESSFFSLKSQRSSNKVRLFQEATFLIIILTYLK